MNKIENVDVAKRCLALIEEIAGQGKVSSDPMLLGYLLEELSQVLFERTGSEDRLFEPISVDEITGLGKLQEELEFVRDSAVDMAANNG